MPGGGVILQAFTVTFTGNGTQAMPNRLAALPAAYCWGPSGLAAAGVTNAHAGGAGGSGSFGGEPAYAGVGPGTVLTATVPASGAAANTTITGGSVTVTGNFGGNASGITAGTPGAASGNTIAFAGGTSGNGASGTGQRGGGGSAGSAGSTSAGGNGGAGSSAAGGSAGSAGTGAAGPPSLAGAAGAVGGLGTGAGGNGSSPGAAGAGGGSATAGFGAAGTGQGGQAIIEWQTLTIIPAPVPRRTPGRAVTFVPLTKGTVGAPVPPSGTVQPWPTISIPRRTPRRGASRGTAVPGIYGFIFPQPPRTAVPARRRPSRAVTPPKPVTGQPPVPVGPPPAIPTSGGDRGVTIRVFREIRPGDVPDVGAQLHRPTGRAFLVPVPTDTEHATHAWEIAEPEPTIEQRAAETIGAALAGLETAKSKALDIGRIFADPPYERKPKTCGAIRKIGGTMLTCGRKTGHPGKHSDRGLDWR